MSENLPPKVAFDKVGFVVPTLGKKIEGVRKAVVSIRANSEDIKIVIVSPETPAIESLCHEFNLDFLPDKKCGLYGAINQGVGFLSDQCEYYGFLGDDDFLTKNAVRNLLHGFSFPNVGVVYGPISYVDKFGNLKFVNPAYNFAPYLLRWGPCLVPHVGSLIRVDLWKKCGGYDESLKFAGDLDFWIKALDFYKFKSIKYPVADFCFDADSLTGGQLSLSISEASQVRLHHSSKKTIFLKQISERLVTTIGEKLRLQLIHKQSMVK